MRNHDPLKDDPQSLLLFRCSNFGTFIAPARTSRSIKLQHSRHTEGKEERKKDLIAEERTKCASPSPACNGDGRKLR